MKEVQLTKGKIALVDDEDFERISQYKWNYGCRGYASMYSSNKTRVYMHRLILNAPKDIFVDHIDGNRLNNCKDNLRLATDSQNKANRGKQKNNTSGYKGVYPIRKKYKDREYLYYKAEICINNKKINLGHFKDIEDARKSYDEACLKHHGEFAKPNIIKGVDRNEDTDVRSIR